MTIQKLDEKKKTNTKLSIVLSFPKLNLLWVHRVVAVETLK